MAGRLFSSKLADLTSDLLRELVYRQADENRGFAGVLCSPTNCFVDGVSGGLTTLMSA